MIKTLVLITGLLFGGTASATLWNVNGVLDGRDGGFGFSSLHEADDSTPMSGTRLAIIDSATGTYNDVSGFLNLVFELDNNDTLKLAGNLLFDGSGILIGNSELGYTGLTNLAASTFGTTNGLQASGTFGYEGRDVCCSGDYDPNSFLADIGGSGLHYLTLWGADFGGGVFAIFDGDYDGSIVGMDFRLELSEVPVPAAIYLFGSALFGLIGWQRRKAAPSAA